MVARYCSGYSGYPTTATTPGVLPTPNNCNSTVPAGPALTGNEYYPADTAVPGAVTQTAPSTILVPGSAIAGSTWMNGRNLLGNGALNGTQVNGTATVTGATTSAPTSAALIADRWVLDTNVGSGAGTSAIVTSTPTPPAGFLNVATVYRASGALTQPICAWQAVPNADSVAVAGQTVTLSAYVGGLANLAADNGSVVNLVIITGTGVDQGFNGSWTATPAITPAWTGIATAVNTAITVPAAATTFARISTSAAIPAAATEIGVGICFTPIVDKHGSTDGFAYTGVQLERGNSPSLYEFKTRAKEIQENQAFVYSIHDTASTAQVIGLCTETTANTDAACFVQYPVAMYKAPTLALTGCGTACFAMPTTTAQTAVTSTCVLTANATFTIVQGTQGMYLQCAQSGTTAAVGITLPLVYSAAATNSGVINAWTGL